MRVFQNIFVYPSFVKQLSAQVGRRQNFAERHASFLASRYCAVHYLQPPSDGGVSVFLTSAADPVMQGAWAREHGLRKDAKSDDILLAQIEEHRTEVFYTQNPAFYGPAFLKRLPGSVKRRVCWQSPPANHGDLSAYDLVLNNFPTSLAEYGKQGVRTGYFTPSHDPGMQPYGDNRDRPIDISFAGGYSRYHRNRASVLEKLAALHPDKKIVFALDRSRLTRLAESPIGRLLPLGKHRRPASIRAVSVEPVFGTGMYELFSKSKIVLNGAVDSAGADRGNMRCFEALGCGALLLTDSGDYPALMRDGESMRVYSDADAAAKAALELLADDATRNRIARRGVEVMQSEYSKANQWRKFAALVGEA